MILKIFFWIFFFILLYTYIIYPVILFLVTGFKNFFFSKKTKNFNYEPDVCLFVTAYNEREYVTEKVQNSFDIDYPEDKIQNIWVTDGSDDGTPALLEKYDKIEVYHSPERKGKIHAINRGMQYVKAPIVIFSDANTLINIDGIRNIVEVFKDDNIGCVSGEKRIFVSKYDAATAAGEGFYWRYESWLKKMDAELNSAVGAVGELFAIRTDLFERVEEDTILDDFVISLRIAQKGYKIGYSPQAIATEFPSVNIKEELKRKVRIAAGGCQTIFRLKGLLNFFKHPVLSWQYISHKVLRWTLAPLSLFLMFLVNGILFYFNGFEINNFDFYSLFFLFQLLFFVFAFFGMCLENFRIRTKFLFIPYYFILTHFAAICGMGRYCLGKQEVNWEKSKRACSTSI